MPSNPSPCELNIKRHQDMVNSLVLIPYVFHTQYKRGDATFDRGVVSPHVFRFLGSFGPILSAPFASIPPSTPPHTALDIPKKDTVRRAEEAILIQYRVHESFVMNRAGRVFPIPFQGRVTRVKSFVVTVGSSCQSQAICRWRSLRNVSRTLITPLLRSLSSTSRMPSRLLPSWSWVFVEARLSMLR